jgi:acyl-coenzyme A synthetase/AMP-(fatty) acid ligase
MSLKLKIKRGTCFLANGRIPELYVTALGTLKYTAVFCPLFSVFGPEPIYQRVSKGDVTILITTLNLYEKSKTISGATSLFAISFLRMQPNICRQNTILSHTHGASLN